MGLGESIFDLFYLRGSGVAGCDAATREGQMRSRVWLASATFIWRLGWFGQWQFLYAPRVIASISKPQP